MQEKRFDFLVKEFSNYEIIISGEDDLAEIINPFSKENIKVYYESEDDYSPYIVCFAFQHVHLCDEELVIDHINDIIGGNLFSIEFFRDGKRCFGGDITADRIKELSYKELERYTGYYGGTKLIECADMFKVRGWNSNTNFDATFVSDEHGKVIIKKID